MSSITPLLDTLLPQVLGRLGDLERVSAEFPQAPVDAVRPITGGRATGGHTPETPPLIAGKRTSAAAARSPAATTTPRPDASGLVEEGANNSAQLHLSRAGDALATLLQRFASAPTVGAIRGSPVFTDSSVPAVAILASLLAGQVTQSGVFYEAHLLAWLQGRYSRRKLNGEPQARLVNQGAAQVRPSAGDTLQRASVDSDNALLRATQTAQATQTAASHHASAGPFDDRLSAVLRQQMEVFATGVFQWQGEAWPGAPMRWELGEDPASERPDADPESPRFSTSLKLELPVLGDLEVRLSLTGGGVKVHASAHQDKGRDLLRADLGTLRARLSRSGFEPAFVELLEERAS